MLSQVDGLLAFKLTASQDRDALDAWIEGQADKAHGKAIKDALPTFKVGEGLVWLPARSILRRQPFPQRSHSIVPASRNVARSSITGS